MNLDRFKPRTRHIPVIYNTPDRMSMVTAGGSMVCQTGTPSTLVPPTPQVLQSKGPTRRWRLFINLNENSKQFTDGFLPLNTDRTRDVMLSAKHDGGHGVCFNCSKEWEGHKCSQCCEGDRECSSENEASQVRGHENRKTQ